MTRTPTKPPIDRSMQRKLKALVHPDNRGDHELFIWTVNIIKLACSGLTTQKVDPSMTYPATEEDPDRVPYPPYSDFEELTKAALRRAEAGDAYGRLLALLVDCRPLPEMREQQRRGASYRMLAAIGHLAGMTKAERVGWYRACEAISLSERAAGHILDTLKGRRA